MLLKDYKNSRKHTNVLVLSNHGQIKKEDSAIILPKKIQNLCPGASKQVLEHVSSGLNQNKSINSSKSA